MKAAIWSLLRKIYKYALAIPCTSLIFAHSHERCLGAQILQYLQQHFKRHIVRVRRPQARVKKSPSFMENSACNDFIKRYKRTGGNKKIICNMFDALPCKHLQIIGISKVPLQLRCTVLDAHDSTVCNDINRLLSKKNLGPLTEFQIEHSVHYGIYQSGRLQTVLTTTTGFLNSRFAIVVSVDWIVSIQCNHDASIIIERLKTLVKKRKHTSYVVTQCSTKMIARKFWKGRLTCSNWAHVYVGLMHIFNKGYIIYEDVDNMIC